MLFKPEIAECKNQSKSAALVSNLKIPNYPIGSEVPTPYNLKVQQILYPYIVI
jgi:hypothetical protein